MKKKILAVSLSLAMAAIAVVGASLAYFTDEDEKQNVFTVGSIQVELVEQQYDEEGQLEEFENDKMLLPAVVTDTEIRNYQDKIVTVTNTGSSDAYVEVRVSAPKALMENELLHLDFSDNELWTLTDGTDWTDDNDNVYAEYVLTYKNILAPGESTVPAMNGLYLDGVVDQGSVPGSVSIDGDDVIYDQSEGTDGQICVPVAVYAIQADGFESAAEAFENW